MLQLDNHLAVWASATPHLQYQYIYIYIYTYIFLHNRSIFLVPKVSSERPTPEIRTVLDFKSILYFTNRRHDEAWSPNIPWLYELYRLKNGVELQTTVKNWWGLVVEPPMSQQHVTAPWRHRFANGYGYIKTPRPPQPKEKGKPPIMVAKWWQKQVDIVGLWFMMPLIPTHTPPTWMRTIKNQDRFGIIMSTTCYWINEGISTKYQTGLVVALKIDPCPPGGHAMWQCVLSKSKRPVLKRGNLSCFNPSLLTTLQTIYPRFFCATLRYNN